MRVEEQRAPQREREVVRPPQDDGALRPFAVPIPEAKRLLGNKARSDIYVAIGDGRLSAIKDGNRTLVTVESIDRYMKSLPSANIKPAAPRRPRRHNRRGGG
jgi:hypothetical protein